jgi:hypothetical protein
LLGRSQSSPTRPSGRSSMKLQTLE